MSAGYVATKHGITHDVFDLHQIEIKEKLDAIAENTVLCAGGSDTSAANQTLMITKLAEIDEVLDTIKLDTRKNISEIQFISNFSLGGGSQLTSTTKNVTGARHCCVVGTESGNSGSLVQLFGGMTSSTGDMYLIGEGFYKETPISGQRLLEFGHISNICFNFCYVKFINTSSTATQVTAKILIRD